MYINRRRELKSYIDDMLPSSEREGLTRVVSALNMILQNVKSYRKLCDIIDEMPGTIKEFDFNIAVSEIANNTAISEEYIKEAIEYIIVSSGGHTNLLPTSSAPIPKPQHKPIYTKPANKNTFKVWEYEHFKDDTLMITKFNGFDEIVDIPSYINGKEITVIGSSAFEGNKKIEKVFFSDNIKFIRERAFAECDSLSEINFSGLLNSIGSKAFSKCPLLKSVELPRSIKQIASTAFDKKTVIIGYRNSEAENYAERNKMKFYQISKR
jgi:hypothetical protein